LLWPARHQKKGDAAGKNRDTQSCNARDVHIVKSVTRFPANRTGFKQPNVKLRLTEYVRFDDWRWRGTQKAAGTSAASVFRLIAALKCFRTKRKGSQEAAALSQTLVWG
jgi:hypothetical protein